MASAKYLVTILLSAWLASCATQGASVQPTDLDWKEVTGSEPKVNDGVNDGLADLASVKIIESSAKAPEADSTVSSHVAPEKDGQIKFEPIRRTASAPAKPLQSPANRGATQPGSKLAKAQLTVITPADKAAADPGVTNPVAAEQVAANNNQADIEKNSTEKGANPVCSEEIDGLAVGEDGCAILDGAVAGIEFSPDGANLTDNTRVLLDSVATVMEKKQDLRLSIATYSQDLDDSALGQLQARRRTLAVIRYLINNGIESARVRPDSSPLADDFAPGDASTNLLVLQTVAE